MALKTCPECKKQVSSSARECPHCGKPLKTKWVSKPAGCFLQVLSIPLIIYGFIKITNGALGAGITVLINPLNLQQADGPSFAMQVSE